MTVLIVSLGSPLYAQAPLLDPNLRAHIPKHSNAFRTIGSGNRSCRTAKRTTAAGACADTRQKIQMVVRAKADTRP